MNIYEELLRDRDKLKMAEEEFNPIDDFLSKNTAKIASLDEFFQFYRAGKDTLIHKAEKDLWKVGENEKGDVIIERLFDPQTNKPLKV